MVHLLRRVAHHYFTHGGHSVFRAHRRHAPQTQTCIVLTLAPRLPKACHPEASRFLQRGEGSFYAHSRCANTNHVIPAKPEWLATAHGGTCWFSWPAFQML